MGVGIPTEVVFPFHNYTRRLQSHRYGSGDSDYAMHKEHMHIDGVAIPSLWEWGFRHEITPEKIGVTGVVVAIPSLWEWGFRLMMMFRFPVRIAGNCCNPIVMGVGIPTRGRDRVVGTYFPRCRCNPIVMGVGIPTQCLAGQASYLALSSSLQSHRYGSGDSDCGSGKSIGRPDTLVAIPSLWEWGFRLQGSESLDIIGETIPTPEALPLRLRIPCTTS